jgi:PAS domain S-box-containing protein
VSVQDTHDTLPSERIAARHAGALMQAMDAIHGGEGPEAGQDRVLHICLDATGAGVAALVQQIEPGRFATLFATQHGFDPKPWAADGQFLDRPRRIADISRKPWGRALPAPMQDYRALLSVPLAVDTGGAMAIVLLCHEAGVFTRHDKTFLRRIGTIVNLAIERHRLQQRNAVLAGLLGSSGAEPPLKSDLADPSFGAVSRALARNADWQARIVAITNRLLGTRSSNIGAGIEAALEETGQLAGSDRTYVFRLRPPDRLDNTHEWVAAGIDPVIGQLQDVPASLMGDWVEAFDRGEAVYIPDISALPPESVVRDELESQGIRSLLAVPMLSDGRLTGFVGYDSVREHRQFLPTEIQLIKSVANAINVVQERGAAEAAAERAQSGLQEERDRLSATLGALPDLVLELDKDARFVTFNDVADLRPFALNAQAIGQTPEDVLPPHPARILREVIQTVDAAGFVEGHECGLVVEGAPRWYLVRSAPLLLHGTRRGYVVFIRDITHRRLQVRQIQRLAKVAELTSNLVVVRDAKGRAEWVNPAFEGRNGWRLEDMRGKLPFDILQSPKTPRGVRQRIEKAYREGKAVQAELLNVTRENEEYWISIDIQPLRDEAGVLQGFVSVATEITRLKQSQQRALRDRAEAMEISNDGIAICAVNGPYSYMNFAHRKTFGIGVHDDVSKMTWHDFYPPETVARFMEKEWPKLLASRAWRGELTGKARDGARLMLEVSLTLKDDGKLLCITRDVSEQVRADQEQARLRDELQIANRRETIAHIASGVAHDLNNLVAVVSGTASLLEAQAGTNTDVQAGISRIRRAMGAAHELVAGLGHLGRPATQRSSQDLRRLVGEAVDLLGSDRIQRHSIGAIAPGSACPVWATPTDILQVVVNLALNACEAGEDGASPRVSLAVCHQGLELPKRSPDIGTLRADMSLSVFTVSDTGTGIDAATRARLFERYYTTKGQKGTGLGLSIVASILRDNDAAMWFESTPGAGTTVIVAWPATPAPTAPQTARRATISVSDVDLSGHNILVVDDLGDVADIFAAMLEAAGAVAISVSDPDEAGRLLVNNPGLWSALVTDFHMPRTNGADLARVALKLHPPVPTVLVTALAETVGSQSALFDAVLPKPVETARLLEAVRAAVRGD